MALLAPGHTVVMPLVAMVGVGEPYTCSRGGCAPDQRPTEARRLWPPRPAPYTAVGGEAVTDEDVHGDSEQVPCAYCNKWPACINRDGLASPPLCFECRLNEFKNYRAAQEEGRRRFEEQRDRERHERFAEAERQRLAKQERMRRAWDTYEAIPAEAKVYRAPRDGGYYRDAILPLGPGELDGERVAVYDWEQRPVARTLDEAREKGWDYFHPEIGWIRGGRKPEREHPDNVGKLARSAGPAMRELHLGEYRKLGGQWPLPKTLQDHVFDLEDRRAELEREIRLAEPRKVLAREFCESVDEIDADVERYGSELERIDAAIAAIKGAAAAPAAEAPGEGDAATTHTGEIDRQRDADVDLAQRDETEGQGIGYGAFESTEHFLRVMKIAVPAVRAQGLAPSQPNVSKWLCKQTNQPHASPTTLKYWRRQSRLRHWEEVIAQVDAES